MQFRKHPRAVEVDGGGGVTLGEMHEVARVSGVHQPSISQFLTSKVDLSDDQLDRLLCCMGVPLGGQPTRDRP